MINQLIDICKFLGLVTLILVLIGVIISIIATLIENIRKTITTRKIYKTLNAKVTDENIMKVEKLKEEKKKNLKKTTKKKTTKKDSE